MDLERHLDRNGTRIIKFFLHLSKEEQRKRFIDRIDQPEKNWKFSLADIEERKFWKDYMRAYEKCLGATSTKHAPWYVVPADDKLNTRLIVSRIVLDTIEALELSYPKTSAARRRELLALRKKLAENSRMRPCAAFRAREDARWTQRLNALRAPTTMSTTPAASAAPPAHGGIACSCDTFASTSPILNTLFSLE